MKSESFAEKNEMYTVHYCFMPLKDCLRLWIGNDRSKYVDYSGCRTSHAIISWFEKYGSEKYEDWKYYYPQKARRGYIFSIKQRGFTEEEALEILDYLPQTDSDYPLIDVEQMIQLWKEHAPILSPKEYDPAKRKVFQNEPDYWETEPYSPIAEEARREGYFEGLAETVIECANNKKCPPERVLELYDLSEEDKKEVLKRIRKT